MQAAIHEEIGREALAAGLGLSAGQHLTTAAPRSRRGRWPANDFMYWEVMRRACRVFDYGRSKVGTRAYSFKKNWGFEPEPWTYEYKLRRLEEVPEINPLNPKYRLFIAAWKHLPIPLANATGPFVVRGLG